MCQIISVDVILLRRQPAKVTFDVPICNRMVQLKIASERSELDSDKFGNLRTWFIHLGLQF